MSARDKFAGKITLAVSSIECSQTLHIHFRRPALRGGYPIQLCFHIQIILVIGMHTILRRPHQLDSTRTIGCVHSCCATLPWVGQLASWAKWLGLQLSRVNVRRPPNTRRTSRNNIASRFIESVFSIVQRFRHSTGDRL